MIKLSDYDYDLPKDLIAQEPAHPRDAARLLVFDRATGVMTDAVFSELEQLLPDKTALVLNNTKVDKVRLLFPGLEVFVTNTLNPRVIEAMVRPGRKFQLGETVQLAPSLVAAVTGVLDDGRRRLELSVPLDDPAYDLYRHTPLPPYIKQDERLSEEYQTVYAKQRGSQAAPTAGLHFTPELLKRLGSRHDLIEVTLRVGLGTFAPLRDEQLNTGKLHEETYEITADAAARLNSATHRTAVGTTSVRVLESAYQDGFTAKTTATDIFIQPGYEFKAVDALVTNFHLPKSSLLMLVAAFMGHEEMRAAYDHAVKRRYRFFSFGDAMLIL